MKISARIVAACLACLASAADAQTLPSWQGARTGIYDPSSNQFGNQNPLASVPAPNTVNLQWTTVHCGSTSTPFGVTGNLYLTIQVPPAAVNVGFAWGVGATATMLPPSQVYGAQTNITWSGGTGACIVATGTQDISVGYR